MNFESVLQTILYVAGIFALLPGVTLLVGALTNLIKSVYSWFGGSFDGKSDQVASWLNLFFFISLIVFKVFSPDITFEFLDARAKLIADALLAVSFFFGQLKLQPISYVALKNKFPLIGKSYSK
mgnify:CR=1 FL=1